MWLEDLCVRRYAVRRPQKTKNFNFYKRWYVGTKWNSVQPPEQSNLIRPRGQPKQHKITVGVYEQPGLSNETMPIRAAKAKSIKKLSEVIKTQNEEEKIVRLEDMQKQVSEQITIKVESKYTHG